MATTQEHVARLVSRLPLGKGHEGQERAVAAALDALLVRGHRGVVLADEVGFGKTYEALAVLTLLREHARRSGRPIERVLILCKPSLVKKWSEEISTVRADDEVGFPQHLRAPEWRDTCSFFDDARVIDRRYVADDLRRRGMRGTVVDGAVQARAGLYIVNHDLLAATAREGRPLLKQLYRTRWDLIIVDEAHHYAKGNRAVRVFAPDEDLQNYNQGIGEGQFRWILALTATPFELRPHEMVKLLALIRANAADLELVDKALTAYVRRLDQLFDRRQRSPSDELRRGDVAALKKLRLSDATGAGASIGLERLLGQYMIRNTKSLQERKYHFVNKIPIPVGDQASGCLWRYEMQAFNKLDDLRSRVAAAPLIPFDGADALFYLQLRRVIQDTIDGAREHEDGRQTFITTDLRQGLSSYPQIASSSLLNREMESAKGLRRIVDRWNSKRSLRLHPKVRAVIDVVREIALYEVKKLHATPDSWISKVLVFNQLIEGTAVQLRQQLEAALDFIFEDALGFELSRRGLGTREALVRRTRAIADRGIAALTAQMSQKFGEASKVPSVFKDHALRRFAGRSLVQIMAEPLRARCRQTLFLLNAVTQEVARIDEGLEEWMRTTLLGPLEYSVERVLRECERAESATSPDEQDSAYERAERDALAPIG